MFSRLQVLPRRLFSSNARRFQKIGLSVGLGVSAIGVYSATTGFSQPDAKADPVNRVLEDRVELLRLELQAFKELISPRKQVTSADIPDVVNNSAFIFIKTHAVTDAVVDLVGKTLTAKGMEIMDSGTITAEEIDEKMLVDQHYYSIASKATLLQPAQLNVPPEKFKNKFGVGWQDALDQGVVYNAKDACEFLELDASGLASEWGKCKKSKKLIKFGGGFYCGLIDDVPNKPPIYVFNGFFMSMRNKYVAPGGCIKYFVVKWNAKKLSWADFRGQLLGPTDPADAPADSLRGVVYKDWKNLGLAYEPNVGDNAIHASASPFEGLAERMNWLGYSLQSDEYGRLMLQAGISAKTIEEWSVDPQVIYGSSHLPIKKSLFDSVEDTDSDMCLARSLLIAQGPI